jgi:hypothetical protein
MRRIAGRYRLVKKISLKYVYKYAKDFQLRGAKLAAE